MNRVTPARLTTLLNTRSAVVVDVRGSTAYSRGHITGSLNIPAGKQFTQRFQAAVPSRARTVVLIVGDRCDPRWNLDPEDYRDWQEEVVTVLEDSGYHHIFVYDGTLGALAAIPTPAARRTA